MFFEPGARLDNGDFRYRLYCKYQYRGYEKAGNYESVVHYPWPFFDTTLDADKLLAYYHMTGFKNWPTPWDEFENHMRWYCVHMNSGDTYWAVAKSQFYLMSMVPIPKEIIHAFT